MAHQDRDEEKAKRASKAMRNALGFYPTNRDSSSEWKVFKTLSKRVSDFLKEKKIFGGNAREFLPKIASFVVDESIELWSYVNLDPSRKRDLEKLLPSRDACEAYVYATLYSCMGAYDKYSTEQREQKSKRPRTE